MQQRVKDIQIAFWYRVLYTARQNEDCLLQPQKLALQMVTRFYRGVSQMIEASLFMAF